MTNRFFFKDVNNEGSFDYKLNGNGNHAPPEEQRQGTLNEQLSYWKGQKRRISQEEYLEETLLENAAFQLATIEIEKYKQHWDNFNVDLYIKYLIAKTLQNEEEIDRFRR